MVEETANLILTLLRRVDAKVDLLAAEIADLKVRVTALEEADARHAGSIAGINRRLDRIEARLDRIERRLDLVDIGVG